MTRVNVKHTSIEIQPYVPQTAPQLERLLMIYDKVTHKHINVGLEYIEEEKRLLIPRGISVGFLEKTFDTVANMDGNHDPVQHIKLRVNLKPKNDNQREAIAFLLGEGKYRSNKKYSRLMLTLDTGEGKTYCAVTTIGFLQMRSAIMVPDNGLMAQWEERFYQYTNITEYDIYRISGSASIKKLMKMSDKEIKYKIFLVSHKTITSYAKKHGWLAITEVFKKMKIGVKIYDEAHKLMHNMIKIDLYTNTKYNLYLTATAGRSDIKEDIIYNRVFSNIPNFFVKKELEDNYLNVLVLQYDSRPSYLVQAECKNMHGFDANKYMNYCAEGGGQELFFKCIFMVLDSIEEKLIQNPNMKIAFLLKRLSVTRKVKKLIAQRYPHFAKSIGLYTSDYSGDAKEKQLQKQIILSTTKSMDAGIDVPGLHYMVMAEPYRSAILGRQVSGRLRNIGEVHYIEIVDMGFDSCRKQFKDRKKPLLNRAKKFVVMDVK